MDARASDEDREPLQGVGLGEILEVLEHHGDLCSANVPAEQPRNVWLVNQFGLTMEGGVSKQRRHEERKTERLTMICASTKLSSRVSLHLVLRATLFLVATSMAKEILASSL